MAKLDRQRLKHLAHVFDTKSPRTFPGDDGSITVVFPEDIAYIRGTDKGTYFYLMDGDRLRTTDLIVTVFEKLTPLSNFAWGDERHIINLDHLQRSTYEYSEYRVFFKSPSVTYARLTPKFARRVAKRLKIPSLRFCTDSKRVMEVCQQFNIRLFDESITDFSKDRLIEEFSNPQGTFVMANLLYNLIWQVYTRMQNDEIPEDEILMGNIRAFWYTYYKSIISKLGMLEGDRYGDMIEAFTRFTADWKLFKYRDWDFWDSNQHNKRIGKGKRMYCILVAEKEGEIPILERIHRKLNITTIALGGEASILSVEYFVDDLEDRGLDKEKEVHVFFATDYDPAGFHIRKTFIKKLKRHYIKNITTHDIITLESFTEDQLEDKKYALIKDKHEHSPNWITRVKKWVRKTGGIGAKGSHWDKRAYGMEMEAIPAGRRMKMYEKAIKPYI